MLRYSPGVDIRRAGTSPDYASEIPRATSISLFIMSSTIATIFLTPIICSGLVNGLAHLPPRVAGNPQQLGHTQDAAFSNQYYSDGGAGGKVNGYNLLTLSDARVGNSYPVHTVYAYAGTRNNDSTQITIIGRKVDSLLQSR